MSPCGDSWPIEDHEAVGTATDFDTARSAASSDRQARHCVIDVLVAVAVDVVARGWQVSELQS